MLAINEIILLIDIHALERLRMVTLSDHIQLFNKPQVGHFLMFAVAAPDFEDRGTLRSKRRFAEAAMNKFAVRHRQRVPFTPWKRMLIAAASDFTH